MRLQTDNQRLQSAGFGAELKTVDSAALRAGKGMLLSANARAGASGTQLDASEALTQTLAGAELQKKLASVA